MEIYGNPRGCAARELRFDFAETKNTVRNFAVDFFCCEVTRHVPRSGGLF
jgi:hypothetical protein